MKKYLKRKDLIPYKVYTCISNDKKYQVRMCAPFSNGNKFWTIRITDENYEVTFIDPLDEKTFNALHLELIEQSKKFEVGDFYTNTQNKLYKIQKDLGNGKYSVINWQFWYKGEKYESEWSEESLNDAIVEKEEDCIGPYGIFRDGFYPTCGQDYVAYKDIFNEDYQALLDELYENYVRKESKM